MFFSYNFDDEMEEKIVQLDFHNHHQNENDYNLYNYVFFQFFGDEMMKWISTSPTFPPVIGDLKVLIGAFMMAPCRGWFYKRIRQGCFLKPKDLSESCWILISVGYPQTIEGY